MGFRVVVDNHLQTWHSDEEPVAVVGQSRGGFQALRFQKQQHERAKYVPLVITLDAAPPIRCPVPGKCVNIQSFNYALLKVPGAENICCYTEHIVLPFTPDVRAIVRAKLTPLMRKP